MAASIATARPGSNVIGVGATDVRSFDSLKAAVDRCVKELGGIDFVMYEPSTKVRLGDDFSDGGIVPVQQEISSRRLISSPSTPSSRSWISMFWVRTIRQRRRFLIYRSLRRNIKWTQRLVRLPFLSIVTLD
jgi:hypothetical protein